MYLHKCSIRVFGLFVDFSIRLVNNITNSSNEGRVEVYYKGEWGTVCYNETPTYANAIVLCRTLGYPDAKFTTETLSFGNASSDQLIWISNLRCDGTEDTMLDCNFYTWETYSYCDNHVRDLAVSCLESKSRIFHYFLPLLLLFEASVLYYYVFFVTNTKPFFNKKNITSHM